MIKRMREWGPRSDPYSMCRGKTKWASEKNAQRALANLRAQNPGAFDSTVRPYRCPACHKWHLGHGV